MWNPIVSFWVGFTETLNTRGGTIALLFLCSVLLGVGVLRHAQETSEGASLLRNAFAAFNGALLIALTTGSDKGNPPTPPAAPPAAPIRKAIP
jgi:hypothetical protein